MTSTNVSICLITSPKLSYLIYNNITQNSKSSHWRCRRFLLLQFLLGKTTEIIKTSPKDGDKYHINLLMDYLTYCFSSTLHVFHQTPEANTSTTKYKHPGPALYP